MKRIIGQEFSFCSKDSTCSVCNVTRRLTEEEEMKQQQRMMLTKDLMKKKRSEGRVDADNRCWVAELLAADCEKAWIHTGWEDAVQKC